MTARTDRLDAQLREEIGQILAREVADPRIGFVTVTLVQTAPDLSHARVWVSILGPAEERTGTLRALRGAMRFVRRRLGERLALRRIPVLHVKLDDAAERGTRMLQLIDELDGADAPADAPPVAPPLPMPLGRDRAAAEEGT
jgi:ribosome-binding factor A